MDSGKGVIHCCINSVLYPSHAVSVQDTHGMREVCNLAADLGYIGGSFQFLSHLPPEQAVFPPADKTLCCSLSSGRQRFSRCSPLGKRGENEEGWRWYGFLHNPRFRECAVQAAPRAHPILRLGRSGCSTLGAGSGLTEKKCHHLPTLLTKKVDEKLPGRTGEDC